MSQYEKLGTSADKADLHAALKQAGLNESSKYFAQLLPDIAGDENFLSFVHSDGAGTKSIVAYIVYREKSSPSAFHGIAQDALVMNLDDLYCVGKCQGLVLSNAVARNAKLIGQDALAELFRGYRECVEEIAKHGISISLGGGETADVGDVVRTLLADATLCGRIAKADLIDTTRITPGDAIVGIASYGKATYEKSENSGIGSNGLTLARHALLSAQYQEKYPEITAIENTDRVKSSGRFSIDDSPGDLGMTVAQALLSPTRTYAPVLKRLYESLPREIHGVIHNTGGGLSKVIRFGRGNRYVKDNLLPLPPLFRLIQEEAKVSSEEMCRVFNLGQRLEVYIPKKHVDQVVSVAKSFGIHAQRIGTVEKSSNTGVNEVVISYKGETIRFAHQF